VRPALPTSRSQIAYDLGRVGAHDSPERRTPACYNAHLEELTHMALIIDEAVIEGLPITTDPAIVSGTPVFAGTRVPVEALMENLAAGVTIDEFLDNFPTVSREQVLAVLTFANETLRQLGQPR
jgi:uncharacterized protein (DUF433 family)